MCFKRSERVRESLRERERERKIKSECVYVREREREIVTRREIIRPIVIAYVEKNFKYF